MKNLVLARIRQLAQEQDKAEDFCLKSFGRFQGEIPVPGNLDSEPEAKLVEVFEQLVAAKAARQSPAQC